MSLAEAKIIGFIPSTNLSTSRVFFSEVLNLPLAQSDEYALEYAINGARLRITKVPEILNNQYTAFGWEVTDIVATIKSLVAKGIRFEVFEGMPQNELGICSFPPGKAEGSPEKNPEAITVGSKVAWLKDPDGNTLSITEFVFDG